MSYSRRAVLACLFAGCMPLSSWSAPDPMRLRAIVDKAIVPLMAQHEVPGMAVALTVDGQPYYFNYGLASREDKLPVTEHTLFELGSISKVFSATLVSYAQAQGKLSLHDHPGKFIPQLKGRPIDKATVLHLGTYTAGGLPLQFPEDLSEARSLDYFRTFKPLAAPGAQRTYSNPSLGLFGHLGALALKRDFADVMEADVLPGLGLTGSYVRVPPAKLADLAWGYDEQNKPRRMDPGVMAAEAYGIRSNASDMIRFVQDNIDPAQLPAPMRRAVAGTQVGYFKVGGMTQGLGWEQYAFPISEEQLLAGNSYEMIRQANPAHAIAAPSATRRPTLFNKTGSTGGFGNYVLFVPAAKIGIVILANKNYPIPARIKAAHAILMQLADPLP